MRSELPLSLVFDDHLSSYPLHPTSDIPTRLLVGSSMLSTLPSPISPRPASPTAASTTAKHVKGHLDKAMRYLLDNSAIPEKWNDPIWLLGVQHTGYETPPAEAALPTHYNAVVPSTQSGHLPSAPQHFRQ